MEFSCMEFFRTEGNGPWYGAWESVRVGAGDCGRSTLTIWFNLLSCD